MPHLYLGTGGNINPPFSLRASDILRVSFDRGTCRKRLRFSGAFSFFPIFLARWRGADREEEANRETSRNTEALSRVEKRGTNHLFPRCFLSEG